MKKKNLIITLIIIIIISVGVGLYLHFNNKVENNDEPTAEDIIDEKTEELLTDENEENVIGHLKIDKIELNAPIKDGTELSILKTAIGHFKNTGYFNGNICFAAHNRGYNQNFFERLNELQKGDKVEYITKYETQEYYISEIKEIEETDLSVLEPTEQDQITMITCIKNQREKRLCVIADRK